MAYVQMLDSAMPYSQFYVDDSNGRYFPYSKDVSLVRGLRPMSIEEMKMRGLTPNANARHTVASIVKLPAKLATMTRSAMNRFVRQNNLAVSIDVSRPSDELRHQLRVMVAERRKEVMESADIRLDAPDSFYTLSIAQLEQLGVEYNLVSVDFQENKSVIQKQILRELNAQERKLIISDKVMAINSLSDEDVFE